MKEEEAGEPSGYAKRKQASDKKILYATMELIQAGGVENVTVEEVAALSGVAKTTIYRRFKNRYELIAAASELMQGDVYVRTDYSFDGVVATIEEFMDRFEANVGFRATSKMLASDADFVQNFRQKVIEPRFDLIVLYLRQGIKLGYFLPDPNEGVLRQMVVGSMVYAKANGDLDTHTWVASMVSMLWPYLTGERHEDPTPRDQRRVKVSH
ncbi:MAG: helix-turn-helix domain containing protein [Actinomycetaceae bacterium]|nr:TetR/AcrR family transcriptional regulator [Arcanobacterium sp.]MDD7505490.1 helix-turn-helix domain containing protein [Actinomycetaceae bacterium]MDY6143471.1 helix-turn-helix domain-containing protein [Arcanobacterium sp.]